MKTKTILYSSEMKYEKVSKICSTRNTDFKIFFASFHLNCDTFNNEINQGLSL